MSAAEEIRVERRSQYRVGPPYNLGARLELEDGTGADAQILDVSVRGASVHVSVALPPSSARHREVCLVLLAPDLPAPLRLRVYVRHVVALSDGWRYGLQFRDARALQGNLPPRLFRLFNRRTAPRAQITPTAAIPVRVTSTEGLDVWARLIDVSNTGLCVELPAAQDPRLAPGVHVHTAFRLGEESVQVVACARHGIMRGEVVRYGLEFVGALTPWFDRQCDAIDAFIASERRAEAARLRARRRKHVEITRGSGQSQDRSSGDPSPDDPPVHGSRRDR